MEVEVPRRAESQAMEVPELDGVVLSKEQARQLKHLLRAMCLICRDVPVPDKLLEALVRLRDENCRNAEQGMLIVPEGDATGRSSQEEFAQIEEKRQLMPNFEAALERLKLNSSKELQKMEKSRRQLKYKRRVRELEGSQEMHPEEYIELNALKLIEIQKRVRSELVAELHLKQNCSRPDSCLFDWGLMRTRYHLLSFLGENYPLSYSGSEEMRKRRDAERQKRLEQEEQARTLARKRKFFCELSDFAKEFQLRMSTFKRIRKLLTDGVVNWHTKRKKKASMAERMRVIALKTDDQEAYMKMVEESKNERLTTLLSKTDELLQKLGAMVQLQKDADPEDVFTKKDKHKDRNKDPGKDAQAKSKQGDAPPKEKENASNVPVQKPESTKRDYLEGQRQYNSAVHQIEEQVTEQPASLQGGQLRIYQLEGLQWMLSLYNNNLNGILADEMGLGKTIQTIALFAYLMENKNLAGPHIVVAPKAVIPNWASEFTTWLPSAITVVYDGRSEERRLLREQHAKEGSFNVLITHYDLVMRDRQFLKRYRWNYMVVDEGHRLKNHDCQLARTLATGYHIRRRLLLTGTPIQNHLQELWSLLNFILPAIFNSSANFEEWFNAPFADRAEVSLTEEEQLLIIRRLHQVLRPFLLRRKKSEVEKYLPSKRQVILKCDLSAWQKQYYKQIIDDGRVGLLNGTGRSRSLQNTAMHLRKCCNHPYLFLDPDYEPATADELVRASGKFELLDRLLPKLQKTGHRVLLFSQMTRLIDILERFLTIRGFKYLRLDGGTKTEDRGQLLKLFNAENSPYFMFLLSTRAGGLGLNLQTADTVIMFDSDWNPQMDQQAEDRAHRIGQKKEVQVFILVSVGSIEEEILERAKSKMGIDAKVIQAGMFNTTSTAAERREMLETIMRRGTDEFSKDVPSEQEINHLTARPEELELYEYMDAERRDKEGYRPRLMQEHEVPEWVFIRADESALAKETPVEGKRKRKEVQYSDILSDSQWLKAVEDGQDVEEITRTEITRRSRRESSSVTPQKTPTKTSKVVLKLRTRYSEVASTSAKSGNSQDEADSVSEEAPASSPSEDKEESSGSQLEWKKVKRRRTRFCTADSGDEEGQQYSEEEESYEKKIQESRSSRKRGRAG